MSFVRITRKGHALLKRIWKVQQDQLEQVTTGLEDDEKLELARLLNKMIQRQPTSAIEQP